MFCCGCCEKKYNTEQSITSSNITLLYDELIKQLYSYNNCDVDIFKKMVDKYKEDNYCVSNKNLLLFIMDISGDMFTNEERCILSHDNEILSWALETKYELIKIIHCGYGSSCNSSCPG